MNEEKIFKVGYLRAGMLMNLLFYAGAVPILYFSYRFGKIAYMTHFMDTTVKQPNGWYAGQQVPNLPMGIFLGISAFAALIVIWKVFCEVLFIIVRHFERNDAEPPNPQSKRSLS